MTAEPLIDLANDRVFSLPLKQSIPLSAVQKIMAHRDHDIRSYYHLCTNTFPIAIGYITAEQRQAVRAINNWQHDSKAGPESFRTPGTRIIADYAYDKRNLPVGDRDYDNVFIPGDYLPNQLPNLPLLSSWKGAGVTLYGRRRFVFVECDSLRRPAGPHGLVIGGAWHNDESLESGLNMRTLSLYSVHGEPSLGVPDVPDLSQPGPWWTTRYANFSGVPLEDFQLFEQNMNYEYAQNALEKHVPSAHLPANVLLAFPTWLPHIASSFKIAPPDFKAAYPEGTPQPQAYVNHAITISPLILANA